MSLALLLQQRAAKNSKPGKGDNFGCKFNATFILEGAKVKPFGKISGQLVIESPSPISHYGIRIQYEALCTLKFESKLDNRVRCHCKCGNLLLEGGEDKDMSDGYAESPVILDLEPIIKVSNDTRPYELQAGINTYGFNIAVPGTMLPSPFKNSYGTLIYKLVAYMRSENDIIVQIGEKALRFTGYYNLSLNSHACQGILMERSVKKSMFTGKKLVTVKLKLDSRGYLPEEQLPFTMTVHNPRCLPYKMSVCLLQKVTYAVKSTKKTTIAVLGTSERNVEEPESETIWDGSFRIHKMAGPTYSMKNQMYTVSHVVQFKVKLDDHNVVKAEHPVFVGTTRETVEALTASANNVNLEEDTNTKASDRRGSVSSNMSNLSLAASTSTSTVSKPTICSEFSTRSSSVEGNIPPVGLGDDDVDSCCVDDIQTTIAEGALSSSTKE